jgi:co-chaperonin GroES (HSP10)
MTADPKLLEAITRGPVRDDARLEGLRERAVQDFVICQEPDLDRKARTSPGSGLLSPTMYQITGDHDRDKPFLGEVLMAGPGQTVLGQHETMCVMPGDILVCNLHNISYRWQRRGQKVYQLRNGIICALVDKETFDVRPVQDFIIVRRSEERALKHSSGGEIWLPTTAMETDDTRQLRRGQTGGSGIVAEYGEVVDMGPGCWRDGNWSAPLCKRGDLILYDASWGTLPITVKGEKFTLVPAKQYVHLADEA